MSKKGNEDNMREKKRKYRKTHSEEDLHLKTFVVRRTEVR